MNILVTDDSSGSGIDNATFDHPAFGGPSGLYSVQMDGDVLLTTSAPDYETTQTNVLVTTVVALRRSSAGGGGSCF